MSSPRVPSSPTGGPSSPSGEPASSPARASKPPGGPPGSPSRPYTPTSPGSPRTPSSPGYSQPPSHSQSQHSGQQRVVQTGVPMIVAGAPGSMGFGPHPAQMTCPFCRRGMVTQVDTQPSGQAWIAFAILCFFGCWWGCCCIPFCMDSCKRTTHTCSNCHRVVGYGGGEAF